MGAALPVPLGAAQGGFGCSGWWGAGIRAPWGAGIGEVVGMGKVARIRDEQMMHVLTVGAGLSRGAGMSRRNGDYWGRRH